MKMKNVDFVKSIFQMYLCFLSENNVNYLTEYCHSVLKETRLAAEFGTMLTMNEADLISIVASDREEGDILPYINVYLWKQRNNKIKKDSRIIYKFKHQFNAWHAHRFMVANGYELSLIPYKVSEDEIATYDSYIEKWLVHRKVASNEDMYQSLLLPLNVIGPKIKEYKLLPEVLELSRYILKHYKSKEALSSLTPTCFALLFDDLSYPEEETWPAYEYLLKHKTLGIFDYVAYLIGIRMYGKNARRLLWKMDIPGGFDLLDSLAR